MATHTYGARVAEVVLRYMNVAGVSTAELADTTLIPRTTLRRKLATGAFTSDELLVIASELGTSPSAVLAEAERAA